MAEPLTFETHIDPSCENHPHCPECGRMLHDDGSDRLVCDPCNLAYPFWNEAERKPVTS